jgi:CMP-N-acetylneuraminic acid synthetase
MQKRVTVIMLGRGGSSGIPGKNVMPILGKAMMEYPLIAASNSRYIKDIYLTTDDQEISAIGQRYGAKIIDRPPELCTDDALFEDALIHAWNYVVADSPSKPEYVVILMCNAPMIMASQIDAGINMLEAASDADSAVTVSKYNMWSPLRSRKLDSDGTLKPFVPFETFGDPATLSCDRDSQGDVFYADMGVSVTRASALDDIENGLLPQKWMGQKILPIDNFGGMDIDYDWQIPIAEFWLKHHSVV